jgi:hypothetical protein
VGPLLKRSRPVWRATAKNAVFAVATTVGCVSVAELLVFAVTFDGQLHEPVEQLRVRDA